MTVASNLGSVSSAEVTERSDGPTLQTFDNLVMY